jgi:hypothetical protein
VTGEQHSAWPVDDLPLEEGDRVVVQVRGGLVQQQDGGTSHQERCQCKSGPLTARQRRERPVAVDVGHTETGDCGVEPRGRRPAVAQLELLGQFAVTLENSVEVFDVRA